LNYALTPSDGGNPYGKASLVTKLAPTAGAKSRQIQYPVLVTEWEFDSPRPHQNEDVGQCSCRRVGVCRTNFKFWVIIKE